MAHPPKTLQPILWSTDVNLLNLEKNKGYIISQVLQYGDLSELQWLFRTYSRKRIKDEFLKHPTKIYFKQPFYFIKNYLLNLGKVSLDEDDYVTSIFGPIRQRAANRI